MPRREITRTDFSAGELSRRADGRFDIPVYRRGCRTLENMVLDDLGGVSMRPGTQYIAACLTSDYSSKLFEFENAADVSFLVEAATGQLTIYDADAEHSTFASPYNAVDVFALSKPQSENTMFLFNSGHRPRQLAYSRSADTFGLSTPTFTGTAFSAAGDRPALGVFHDRRLVVGFPTNNPLTVWGSYVPDNTGTPRYTAFTLGTTDDVAWRYTIASKYGDVGRWMISEDDLLIGGRRGEYRMTGFDAGITPTNVFVRGMKTNIGGAGLEVFSTQNSILFVQRGTKRVYSLTYTTEGGGYSALDLTHLAEHITGIGIVDVGFQTNPKTILWCVTSDGTLIGLTFNKELNVIGWHRHVTSGYFESVAVLSGSTEDSVYVVVKRTINSSTVRYIEKLKPFDWGSDNTDRFFVDSGITWDGGDAETITAITKSATCQVTFAATTAYANDDKIRITDSDMTEVNTKVFTLKNKSTNTFDLYTEDGTAQIDSIGYTAAGTEGTGTKVIKSVAGLSHLEGESVVGLRDGAVQTAITVASGVATLSQYANKVHLGLSYTGIVEPMPLVGNPAKEEKINHLVVQFYKTVSAKWGRDSDNLDQVVFGETTVLGQPPAVKTQTVKYRFRGSRDLRPTLRIVQDEPNPMTVLSITAIADEADE